MSLRLFSPLALIVLCAVSFSARADEPPVPRDLRCEYAVDPLAVEGDRPRLSYRLESARRGAKQSAYQLLVASTVERLESDRPDLWDSGRVPSGDGIQIVYRGKTLRPGQRAHWKVRIWDDAGRPSAYARPAFWERAPDPRSWDAEWIGYPAGSRGRALYFRHELEVAKPIRAARIHVAGIGYHELSVNGAKVGREVLAPAWTDYGKRVLYVTHDLTALLRPGANVIGVVVGHGWYGDPRLLAQIEIEHTDGSRARASTSGGHSRAVPWRVTTGPIRADSIYDGEHYDARLEKPGWDRPGKLPPVGDRGEGWATAMPVEPPGGKLVAQQLEPIEVVETRAPVAVKEPRPGVFVFDTGQNLAGWAALSVRGPAGTRVTLRFAENLAKDGTVDQANLRKAAATDVYVLKGAGGGMGEERWEPRFTYHGFRYVEVEGLPSPPGPETIRVRLVRSAVESAGTFASSSPLLDRIHQMVRATEASNLHGVPTDCPQRDERMGWMNDLTVRMDQALYNFRLARFYTKFLDDVRDTQDADGAITDTAPFKWGKRPADPVSVSYLLLPWLLYQHYGDTAPMARHYDGVRAWVDYLDRRTDKGVLSYGSWGDWSPPKAFGTPGSPGAGAVAKDTPLPLMSTGYLHESARLLAEMARVLGKRGDERKYRALAARTAAAFDGAFRDPTTGGYGRNNQAANAFALFLGVVPPTEVSRVVGNLARDVAQHGYHLTTGNLCTKYLLETLTEHGHAEAALKIATQETYPSWGFMLANGATTLWERWEHLTGGQMNSHNHPMMGSVGSWFYKYLAGILPDPAGPGFRRFVVRPHVVAGLDHVRATHDVLQGRIESAWKREGDGVTLSVTVPVNTTATVHVPGRADAITEGGLPARRAPGVRFLREENGAALFEIGSGAYTFVTRR